MFNRIRDEEQGFTLIELLVVILIIGILIAVAAPSFLGQQDKAKDSAVKQNMTVLYKAAKAEAASNSSAQNNYPIGSPLVKALQTSEPQLTVTGSTTATSTAAVTFGAVGTYDVGTTTATSFVVTSTSGSNAKLKLTASNAGAPDIVTVP